MRAVRVVADDDVLLREGIASLLERSGFEVAGRAGGGSGIVGLRDRVEALSGRLEVTGPPGGGTTLIATIPQALEAEEQLAKSGSPAL